MRFNFVFRFLRALAKAEEATTIRTIRTEYERLQERGKFFLDLLKGAKEESLKIFADKFSQIPMDVMTALKVKISYWRVGTDSIFQAEVTGDSVGAMIMEEYRLLCREGLNPLTSLTSTQSETARCYYKSNSAHSRLRPEKVEIYRDTPRILMFHDVVTTDQAQRLLALSSDKLVGSSQSQSFPPRCGRLFRGVTGASNRMPARASK